MLPKFVSLQQQTISRVKEFIDSVQRLATDNENENLLHDDDEGNEYMEYEEYEYMNFLKHVQTNLSDSKVHNHVIRLGTQAKKTLSKRNPTTEGTRKFAIETPRNDTDKLDLLVKRIKQEKETLFFIVLDEAHYGTTLKSDFNVNFNTPEMANTRNVILLQVTATPYSLVTSNSRIPESNRIDWFSDEENETMVSLEKSIIKYNTQPLDLRLLTFFIPNTRQSHFEYKKYTGKISGVDPPPVRSDCKLYYPNAPPSLA